MLKWTLIMYLTLYGMPEGQRTLPYPFTSLDECQSAGLLLMAKYSAQPLIYKVGFECRPQPNIPETD